MSNFFGLPCELRDLIYKLCLLHDEPLNPWIGSNHRRELTFGLFRASKAAHLEASLLFYSQNYFDFTTAASQDVAAFFESIGHNASYIRHVRINFPQFLYLDPGDIALEDSHITILSSIINACANLTTLTTSLYSTNTIELRLDNLDHPKIVTDALKLVNTHFRASTSLQSVIIELYEECPNSDIRQKMERHGWTITTTQNVEEVEDDMSLGGFDEYDDYCDYNDDEYDIDNDSDFWRRAAD